MKRVLCAAALIAGALAWGGPSGVPTASAATVIDLTSDAVGDVEEFVVTPDGGAIVFVVDDGGGDVLYVKSVAGGLWTRLDEPNAFASGISRLEIVLNGTAVLYHGDDQIEGRDELFLVPIDGSSERERLSVPLGGALTADVRSDFAVSAADDGRVVYAADPAFDGSFSLFSTPLDSGPSLALLAAVMPTMHVEEFQLTPDGSNVVIRATTDEPGDVQLLSSPVDAVGLHTLSQERAPGSDGFVQHFRISADSSRVAFTFDRDVTEWWQLYSVPVTGDASDVSLLSPPIGAGDDIVLPHLFFVSPDSERVVFSTDGPVGSLPYSVPIDGGLITQLYGGLAEPDLPALAYGVNSSSGRVLIVADLDPSTASTVQLFEVGPSGGSVLAVSDAFDSTTHEFVPVGDDNYFLYNESGSHLLHRLATSDSEWLYSSDIATGEVELLSGGAGGEFTLEAAFSPDGREVLHVSYDAADPSIERLWRIPARGGKRELVHEAESISEPQFDAESDRLFWSADRDGHVHVYATSAGLSPGPGGGGPTGPSGPLPVPAGIEGSVFEPVDPFRAFDTRGGTAAPGPKGVIPAGGSIDIQIAGVGGVPEDAVAVVMNATATEGLAAGFTTFHETGVPRPLASSLNVTAANQNRPNMVVVPIGDGGRITAFSQSGGHLLGDVMGYFSEVDTGVSAGRIMPLDPTRVLETRGGEPGPGPKGFVGAGQTIDVQIAGVGGVPDDAIGVVINLTATDGNPGFVSMWPAGTAQPLVSTLNVNVAGETTPNLAIMPLGDDGKLSLFSQAGTHLVADVTGYVTGASAPVDSSGVFVVTPSARIFETRPGEPGPGPKGFVEPGTSIVTQFTGVAGVPDDVGLVLFNLTGDQAATGFVTSHADDIEMPLASSLNFNGPNDTRPNAVAIPPGDTGKITHYSQNGAHLLADIAGYTLP